MECSLGLSSALKTSLTSLRVHHSHASYSSSFARQPPGTSTPRIGKTLSMNPFTTSSIESGFLYQGDEIGMITAPSRDSLRRVLEGDRRQRRFPNPHDQPHSLLQCDLCSPGDQCIGNAARNLAERRDAARHQHKRIIAVGPGRKRRRQIVVAEHRFDVRPQVVKSHVELVLEHFFASSRRPRGTCRQGSAREI